MSRGRAWTDADDAIVRDSDLSDVELAKLLNRSITAIKARKRLIMPEINNADGRFEYAPTEAEIAAACAKIREKWTRREAVFRRYNIPMD